MYALEDDSWPPSRPVVCMFLPPHSSHYFSVHTRLGSFLRWSSFLDVLYDRPLGSITVTVSTGINWSSPARKKKPRNTRQNRTESTADRGGNLPSLLLFGSI